MGSEMCIRDSVEINPQDLPMEMDVEIFLDLGENSNANMLQKYQQLGSDVLPALNAQGQGMVVKPEAPAIIATRIVESLGLDSNDFFEDYTTDEFKEKAAKAVEEQTQEQMKTKALEDRKMEADAALAEANVAFTGTHNPVSYTHLTLPTKA